MRLARLLYTVVWFTLGRLIARHGTDRQLDWWYTQTHKGNPLYPNRYSGANR